jgi:hypothetical protein
VSLLSELDYWTSADLFHAHLLLLGSIPAEVVNNQSSLVLEMRCTCLQQAMPVAHAA